jgi:hypothetical protein
MEPEKFKDSMKSIFIALILYLLLSLFDEAFEDMAFLLGIQMIIISFLRR